MTEKQICITKIALQLQNWDKIGDYYEICRQNTISRNAWTRGNNSGNSEYLNKMDKKADKAWQTANHIAAKYGWTISAPGLYWVIKDKKGREII